MNHVKGVIILERKHLKTGLLVNAIGWFILGCFITFTILNAENSMQTIIGIAGIFVGIAAIIFASWDTEL